MLNRSGCLSWFCLSLYATIASAPSLAADSPAPMSERPLVLDLAGLWAFQLDPQDAGVKQRWFERALAERVKLPGSLQEQGFGLDVSIDTPWTGGVQDRSWYTSPRFAKYREPGHMKVPFWLQPDKHFIGAAWYQREVTIPADWTGKHIVLHLERPHWATTVWVDGTQVGTRDSLSTPHTYDVSSLLSPGIHRLTIRVDNRLKVEVGVNAHSVSDHTQSNWNGIVGRLQLRAGDPVWIDDVQVFPDVASRSAKVKLAIGNPSGKPFNGMLTVRAAAFNTATPHTGYQQRVALEFWGERQAQAEFDYVLGEGAQLWDEFHPALYRLTVQLEAEAGGRRFVGESVTTFGMRNLATQGTQFLLNGRPLFLRGTLECCIFPHTGYPPTDVESWKRVLRRCQAHGLNHVRFHSWCPPAAAFAAADELGVYFYVECAAWSNQGATIGDGKPIDRWLYAEADRILRAYGNHPSFLLMSYGNEPAGPGEGAKYLGPWVTHFRSKDARRLYTSAAGWPMIPENQFHVTPAPRIHGWGEGLQDRINAAPPQTTTDYRNFVGKWQVPVVSHEIGQWCVYPNFEEIPKYTGVLKAKNFEVFRDFLVENHMGDQARDFLMASGKLQTLCYKEEVESALRTPGFGGFELLDLHDFPGQGTALVGVLDPFWDSKPYVGPDEFRRFCSQTVPLARLAKRIFTQTEALSAAVEVCHFGPHDLKGATIAWRLLGTNDVPVASGKLPAATIAAGRLSQLGKLEVPLRAVVAPQKLRLAIGIEGTPFENDWDVWVYPPALDAAEPNDVLIVRHLNDAALARLNQGGKVLLLTPPQLVKGGVALGFSPVFWNTAWTGNQAPHTLGILCDPRHPALAKFPTEYHTNWQWWELISRSGAMVLDKLPPELRPIVQVIDTWFEARRLGLLIEAKVGGGSLLVCSMDLASDLAERPVARQMRRSLLEYMRSDRFRPGAEVGVAAIRDLSRPPSKMEQLGAAVTADSQQRGFPAEYAVDGNPDTIWHTAWESEERPYPHHLVIQLREPAEISGLAYLPRQDMTNGRIADYAVYLSTDGKSWGEPVAVGTWPNTKEWKRVTFPAARSARYIKLVARSEVQGRVWASAAELEVLTP